MNLSGAVADFFAPFFQDALLDIDWIDSSIPSFSVQAIDTENVLRQYTTGKCLRSFDFAILARLPYVQGRSVSLENLELWNRLSLWVAQQNRNRILPTLPSDCSPQTIQVIRPGLLQDARDDGSAVYKIICRLIYLQ